MALIENLVDKIIGKSGDEKRRLEQVKNAGKAADYFFKSLPQDELGNPVLELEDGRKQKLGLPNKTLWETLGSEDRSAAVSGILEKFAVQKAASDLNLDGARVQTMLDEVRRNKEQAAQDKRFGEELRTRLLTKRSASAQEMSDTMSLLPPAQLDPQDFLTAALETGQPPAQGADIAARVGQALTAMRSMQPEGGDPKVTMLDAGDPDVSKIPFISWNKGRSGQISPAYGANLRQKNELDLLTKRNEAKEHQGLLPPGTQLSVDESGSILATTPEGWVKPLGKADAKTAQRLRDAKTIVPEEPEQPGFWSRLFGKGKAAAPTPSPDGSGGALALPKTQAELKTGQIYQTSKGPATWDGQQFVK